MCISNYVNSASEADGVVPEPKPEASNNMHEVGKTIKGAAASSGSPALTTAGSGPPTDILGTTADSGGRGGTVADYYPLD